MNMLVQKYLLTHSLADLERDHAVKAKWSQDGTKFSFSKNETKFSLKCYQVLFNAHIYRHGLLYLWTI